MKKTYLLLANLFFLFSNYFSQLTFNKSFNVPSFGGYSNVKETKDKGYFFGGYAFVPSANATDAFVIKLNKNGNEQWRKIFGGIYNDYSSDVISLSDGGFLAIGNTNSITFSYQSFFTKFDSLGNILWIKSWSPNFNPIKGFETKKGELLFLTEGPSNPVSPVIIKTNAQCNGKWSKVSAIYGGYVNAKYFSYALTPTLDNGAFFTATCDTNPTFNRKRIFCVKLDSLGNVNWSKSYYNSYTPVIQNAFQQSDSTYLLVGTNDTLGLGKKDICLIKLNSNGNLLWSKVIGNINSEYGSDVIQSTNNEIIVVGKIDSLNNNDPDGLLVKLDQNGNFISASTIGVGGKYDLLNAIQPAANTEFILTGSSNSVLNLYKLNSNLQLGCTELNAAVNVLNLPMNTSMSPAYLYTTSVNTSTITLNQLPNFGNLVDICTNIGVFEIGNSIRFFVYPNPVINTLNIETEQSFETGTEIEITNALGQIILKHSFNKEINVSQLSNGYYFLKVITPNRQLNSKFIKE